MTPTTVVGYDGSETAKAALAYAASRTGAGGRVVVAHVLALPVLFVGTEYYDDALELARQFGATAMREVEDLLAGVPSEPRVLEGPPARTLVQLAREEDAEEIVVGSRGFGAGRAVLGSVSHALLHESDRPLVILTGRAAEGETRRAASRASGDRGTVVGYDGSETSRAALDYAIARARGPITVVTAYDAPSSFLGKPYFGRALRDSQLRGQQLLDELAGSDGLSERVEYDLLEGPPAEALVSAALARDAAEIVVGTRGLGRFRGAFGSVSHALLHQADRPLVIVPQSTHA